MLRRDAIRLSCGHGFVHIFAVQRAGLATLNDGQQVQYEVVESRGKTCAENPKVSR